MSFKYKKLKVKYDDIMQQIKDGTIEEAISTEEYMLQHHIITHYLPHHSVTKEGELRIMYEG